MGSFGFPEGCQGVFPPLLELGGYQAVVWIYPIELAFRRDRFLAHPLCLLLVGTAKLLILFLLGSQGPRKGVQFYR